MAQQDNELTGPDLAQGVPARDLQERTPLLGHAAGEAVLLTRCDGKVYATGATCTHYGAPLVDGIVEGGAIRCPWHHSAFSLATGAAVRPPGLSDLACWQVEERDGVIRVGARADVARAVATSDEKHPASVVIIGGGAAGLVAADTLRRERYRGPITMITADTVRPVDRPNLSKDYLAGNAPEEWIPLRPDAWYDEHGIDVRLGRRAVGLDPRARRVTLDDGSALDYGALLLSTGAEPIRLPLGDAPVHYLRTLHDCRAIIAATESAKRAVVIGASFIGLEVAASLRARGLDVTVVAPEAQPLERVLGAEVGAFIREVHEGHGVTFRLGRTVRSADGRGVVLDDGASLPADLVVAGVGVRPNVALAEAAGLALDRGVTVDAFLETSAPGVFAAGDIARWPDPHSRENIRVEHWVLAQRQAQTAARNMLGAGEPFTAVPFFWSAHFDVTIAYVGHATRIDRVEIDGELRARDCTIRYMTGARVAAVATIGRDKLNLAAEVEMERAIGTAA